MIRFYSILKLTNPDDDQDFQFVVCDTRNDESEVIDMALRRDLVVTNMVAAENKGKGIFQNDFET